jgi:TatD DNase family protein
MFDTHAHVQDARFDDDRDAVLARAKAAGVERIMTIGTDLADSRQAAAVAAHYGLDYALGIHPHEAKDAPRDVAAAFDELVAQAESPPRAVGEMGLDYYYDHSPRDVQKRVLVAQLRYARERGLPAVFHQRDAFDDFVATLREERAAPLRGVVHCFTGTAEEARVLVGEFGLRLGIGGVVTFKTAEPLREAVVAVGLEHIVLETDCPYLAPVPHRGARNEPAFVAATAARLAELFGTTVDEIVTRTTATARSLFGG